MSDAIDREFMIRLWAYREKDAWFDFCDNHPELEDVCSNVLSCIQDVTSDPYLRSGIQIEAKLLRVAFMLGLTDVDVRKLTEQ